MPTRTFDAELVEFGWDGSDRPYMRFRDEHGMETVVRMYEHKSRVAVAYLILKHCKGKLKRVVKLA